jgi:hypothetical protein
MLMYFILNTVLCFRLVRIVRNDISSGKWNGISSLECDECLLVRLFEDSIEVINRTYVRFSGSAGVRMGLKRQTFGRSSGEVDHPFATGLLSRILEGRTVIWPLFGGCETYGEGVGK